MRLLPTVTKIVVTAFAVICTTHGDCRVILNEINILCPGPTEDNEFIEIYHHCDDQCPAKKELKGYYIAIIDGRTYPDGYKVPVFIDLSGKRTSRSGFFVVGNHEKAQMKPFENNFIYRKKYLRPSMVSGYSFQPRNTNMNQLHLSFMHFQHCTSLAK